VAGRCDVLAGDGDLVVCEGLGDGDEVGDMETVAVAVTVTDGGVGVAATG
jgi:hypothetical protein